MSEAIMVYQHSLPEPHYGQLCALPEVIARYAPGANQSQILREIREDFRSLEIDPETGRRLLEVSSEDQDDLLKMLAWAAERSQDDRFSWLAQEILDGARETDREISVRASMN